MKINLYIIFLTVTLYCCTKPTNAELVRNTMFNCYNKVDFGELRPALYKGLPQTCISALFKEEFNDNSYKWFTENTSDAVVQVTNGVYSAKTKSKYSYYYVRSSNVSYKNLDNFQIESNFLISNITDPNNYFGITWGGLDWNFNCIGLKMDGKMVQGKNLVQTTKPTIIFSSPSLSSYNLNSFNKLTIRKFKDTTYVFLNEELITQLNTIELVGDDFGFFIPANCDVKIENIEIIRWDF